MAYIGKTTDGFGVRNRFVYLASSGATSVSGADANGATLTFTDGAYVDVYLNGVLLKPTTDYNTSTANTIAGLSALNTNDEVTVVVYDVFTVADMVSATSGGTFVGNVTFDGTVTNNSTTALKEDVVFHGSNYNVTWDKSDSALEFGDNAKLTFGSGNDLRIYHTPGTGSFIDEADDGSLFIRSSRVTIHKYTGETMINAVADGAVTLSYNDNQRFATTDLGFDIINGGTSFGSFELTNSDNLTIDCNSTDHAGLTFGTAEIFPRKNAANSDDGVDLGAASIRFDDIHATNGTIQTSDQNEKQDIASATAKELNVAKKLSSLFKTFRWKSKVAEKGDNARIHTGIIAQEIQSAFSAEGLDASKYGLFTSHTWWEKDKEVYNIEKEAPSDAIKRTRLGVRYPELFSFIFSSIEARLTALESK